jgi:hypothetical protein
MTQEIASSGAGDMITYDYLILSLKSSCTHNELNPVLDKNPFGIILVLLGWKMSPNISKSSLMEKLLLILATPSESWKPVIPQVIISHQKISKWNI